MKQFHLLWKQPGGQQKWHKHNASDIHQAARYAQQVATKRGWEFVGIGTDAKTQ